MKVTVLILRLLLCLSVRWLINSDGFASDLERITSSSSIEEKGAAAQWLIDFEHKMSDEQIVPILGILLTDPSWQIRRLALYSTTEILSHKKRSKLALAVKQDVTRDVDASSGDDHIVALRALSARQRTLSDPNRFLLWQQRTIVDPVKRLAVSKQYRERLRACELLTAVAPGTVNEVPFSVFHRLLTDRNVKVRTSAFQTLEGIAYDDGTVYVTLLLRKLNQPITTALTGSNTELRRAALRLQKRAEFENSPAYK